MDISWLSTGIRKNLWISLHDAETVRKFTSVGDRRNGQLALSLPRELKDTPGRRWTANTPELKFDTRYV